MDCRDGAQSLFPNGVIPAKGGTSVSRPALTQQRSPLSRGRHRAICKLSWVGATLSPHPPHSSSPSQGEARRGYLRCCNGHDLPAPSPPGLSRWSEPWIAGTPGSAQSLFPNGVIPAKAGTSVSRPPYATEIPAFAGTTSRDANFEPGGIPGSCGIRDYQSSPAIVEDASVPRRAAPSAKSGNCDQHPLSIAITSQKMT